MPTGVPGYANAIVRVDLSRREATAESLPADQLRKWLGGPAQGKSILAGWDRIVDVFYRERGWDPKTSRPLPETLRALGLEDFVAELWAVRA